MLLFSLLPASFIDWLQYRLLWIEIKFAINTGHDEHGAIQFYWLRIVSDDELVEVSTLYRRYGDCSIHRIGGWYFVLVWSG